MGPVVSEAQWGKIQPLIRKGIEEGATLVAGGTGRPEGYEVLIVGGDMKLLTNIDKLRLGNFARTGSSNPSNLGTVSNQAADIAIHAKEILSLRAKLNEIMAHHTGQPIERIERDTDRDNFLSAQEATEYGLIDKVLANRNTV